MLSLPLAGPVEAIKAGLAYVFHPVAFAGARGIQRLSRVPSGARRLIEADQQNLALQEELRLMSLLRKELESARAENSRLRGSLGLKLPGERSALWAHVMERDPVNWYHGFMVDAGVADGVTLNAAVLAVDGERLAAVGRIVEIGPRASKVLLLTDEQSSVAAYLSSGTLEGLVQGQGGERLRLNYLDSEAVVVPGDSVFTSGASATFPPDVPIGLVSKAYQRDPFLTFQSVEVKPVLSPSRVREVMILKGAAAP